MGPSELILVHVHELRMDLRLALLVDHVQVRRPHELALIVAELDEPKEGSELELWLGSKLAVRVRLGSRLGLGEELGLQIDEPARVAGVGGGAGGACWVRMRVRVRVRVRVRDSNAPAEVRLGLGSQG